MMHCALNPGVLKKRETARELTPIDGKFVCQR